MIGGMSWESSKVYYELTNKITKERLGGSHSARSILITVDFAEIERLTFQGDWDAIGTIMADHTRKLERAGADAVLLCTNTIHLVSHQIEAATTLPFLHIAEATGDAVQRAGLQKVGLLGTRFTMEKDFYTKILQDRYGLQVVIPSKMERQTVHDLIYDEMVKGRFTEHAKQSCLRIIDNLERQGAQGVILGCTELPILLSPSEVAIPIFDTTRIHVEKAMDFALAKVK